MLKMLLTKQTSSPKPEREREDRAERALQDRVPRYVCVGVCRVLDNHKCWASCRPEGFGFATKMHYALSHSGTASGQRHACRYYLWQQLLHAFFSHWVRQAGRQRLCGCRCLRLLARLCSLIVCVVNSPALSLQPPISLSSSSFIYPLKAFAVCATRQNISN